MHPHTLFSYSVHNRKRIESANKATQQSKKGKRQYTLNQMKEFKPKDNSIQNNLSSICLNWRAHYSYTNARKHMITLYSFYTLSNTWSHPVKAKADSPHSLHPRTTPNQSGSSRPNAWDTCNLSTFCSRIHILLIPLLGLGFSSIDIKEITITVPPWGLSTPLSIVIYFQLQTTNVV